MCFCKCSQKWIFHLPCFGICFGVRNEYLPPLLFIGKVTLINYLNSDFDQIRVWWNSNAKWHFFPLTFWWTCSGQSFTFTLPFDCEGNFAIEALQKLQVTFANVTQTSKEIWRHLIANVLFFPFFGNTQLSVIYRSFFAPE